MKVIIDGLEFRKCGFCDSWHSELICPCFFEKQSKELRELLNIYKKRNEVFIFCTPNKFLVRGLTTK